MSEKDIIKIIKDVENPYPKDIFVWNSKGNITINKGRLNRFAYECIEYFREKIIKEIKEVGKR